MKRTLQLAILLMSGIVFAQIPSYYNDVDLSLTGNALQSELGNKVSTTHTQFLSYTPGVWDALKQSDLDPTNSNDVLLIYGYDDNDNTAKTDRTRGKDENGGGTGLWNREHVYPKSLGTPNLGTTGAGSDAHHLRPSDGQMNSSRSNRKFASGSGTAAITAQGHFYPGDEWKGDVARMILFMYTRYESRCLPSNVGVGSTNSQDSNMINLFLDWNAEDPVSSFEDQRNNTIANIQGNRNPFIDNPAFATQIWGGPQAQDRFGSGGGSGGNSGDLFISEYVEGSSNNKAIEIANFTGASVNLSNYQLKKQTNGAGNWSSGYTLSGSLSDGDVYVVANSSASSAVTANANATTNNASLTFNGNDPVGLFKNNVLIDIVGTFNGGSSNFAKDKTLRRKSEIIDPNTTYTTTDWDVFNQNTFDNLGTHSTNGGGGTNPPVSYCESKGNNASFEYIDLVSLGGISNATGSNNGYEDFTNQTGSIGYGSNTVVFSAGFSSSSYTEFWKIWIDYNQNGTFENSEEIVSGSSSSAGNLSGNFTVPTSALSGPTTMRVSMKWDATQTACETFSYGEVEDYTINITSGLAPIANWPLIDEELRQEEKVFNVQITDRTHTLEITMGDQRSIAYRLYTISGQLVYFGNFYQQIKLDQLEAGMYILHLNDGQRLIQKKIQKK